MQVNQPKEGAEKATTPAELLPCPFCGNALVVKARRHNPHARCETENCKGSQLPLLNLDQMDDIARWNTRPAQTAALDDTARLDFMFAKHRKVVVELVPGRRHEVYVEEGFMAEEQYPAVIHAGGWADGSSTANEVKRKAIDAAMAAVEQGGRRYAR